MNAIAGATTPGPISATPSSYVDKSDKIDRVEKEKSFAKMAHYISELKRELDVAQKQRKDASLETQGLRDKCQQLEDRLSVEQARAQGLEERLDRAKGNQRLLQAQIDAQSLKIVEQETIISNFSSKSNDIGVAGSANSNNNANIAVGSLLVTENNS